MAVYNGKPAYKSRPLWLSTGLILICLWTLFLPNSNPIPENTTQTTPSSPPESADPSSELVKDPLRIYIPPAELPSSNPLDDIWEGGASQPVGNVSPETYHQGPTEKGSSSTSKKECPIQPFDISKCPSVQSIQEHTSTPWQKDKPHDRPLVSYAYYETDFARINLEFFIKHGLHDAADFVFILNGETDVDEVLIPQGRTNINIVKRDNTCFDLGAHHAVLTAERDNGRQSYKDSYKRFILMNASIRGPFVPHWSRECWSDAYLGRLNERVKLVGSSLNCLGGSSPHVQSMIWATDKTGLDIILEPEGIGECFDSLDAAMGAEVRTTPHLRSKGYEVDVMLSIFQTEKDYKYINCKDPNDFLFEDGYFGFSVHPYETLFLKSHRGIEDNMLDKLSVWQGMSGYTSYDVCKR